MTNTNEINNDMLAKLGLSVPKQNNKKELGQEDFLKLLVAQSQNVNPLDPQDGGEFLGQLAQFGTVDGISGLQKSLDSLGSSLQSNQALQAASLVGHSVLVPGNGANLAAGGKIKGSIELPSSVSNLTVNVLNAEGALVKQVGLGTQAAGEVTFEWDGTMTDGSAAPAGTYQIQAQGLAGGSVSSFNTFINANVDSVTLGENGSGLILNLSGIGSVPVEQVKQIN